MNIEKQWPRRKTGMKQINFKGKAAGCLINNILGYLIINQLRLRKIINDRFPNGKIKLNKTLKFENIRIHGNFHQ